MTIKDAKDYLLSLTSHITFVYNGTPCGVDPLSRTKFNLWYGIETLTVTSVDAVMTTKLFSGRSLEDIWDHIAELEY